MADYPLSNLTASADDPRDYLYYPVNLDSLPKFIDLKPDVLEVDNQLSINSCTANAATSAIELLLKKHKKETKSLSRLFVYWNTRNLHMNTSKDDGASLGHTLKSLSKEGVCYEDIWTYNSIKESVKPDDTAYAQAESLNLKVTEYEKINTNHYHYPDPTIVLKAIKSALNEGLPVMIGMSIGKQIYSLKGDWKKHDYQPVNSETNPKVALHAMLIIGYSDDDQRFLVENSWGPSFGDGGFFGLPYNTFLEDIRESWVIRGFNTINIKDTAPVEFNFPLTLKCSDRYTTIEHNLSATETYGHEMKVAISGGVEPYNIKIGTNNCIDQGNDMYQFYHTWEQDEKAYEEEIAITVLDSAYPKQGRTSKMVNLKFIKQAQESKQDQEKKKKKSVLETVGEIVGFILIIAIGTKYLGLW